MSETHLFTWRGVERVGRGPLPEPPVERNILEIKLETWAKIRRYAYAHGLTLKQAADRMLT